jgi:hypothetical protein
VQRRYNPFVSWPLPIALAASLIGPVAATAHHSIAGAYDSSRRVTIDAVVSRFHFVNPHPYITVDVKDASTTQSWHLELDNRGELAAVGMTAETLRPGDRVVVTGSQSRSEPRSLYVRTLVRPSDGFEYEQVGASPRIKGGR